MSIRDANAVSRTTAEFLRTLQADSVADALAASAKAGAPRWAWVVLDTRVTEGLEGDDDFVDALYTGHVVSWWAADVESRNAPEQRRLTADDTCLVYFAQMMPAQVDSDSALGLPIAFAAVQTGSRDGVPQFVVPGAFHLDRLSLGSAGAWGDTLYREAHDWKRLPIGTAGKVLTAKTVSGHVVPSWETPSAGSGPAVQAWANFTNTPMVGGGGFIFTPGVSGGLPLVAMTRVAAGLYTVDFTGLSMSCAVVASGISSAGGPVTVGAQPYTFSGTTGVTLTFDLGGVPDDPSFASLVVVY